MLIVFYMVQFKVVMNSTETQSLPTSPSLMKSLMAGFDAISNHVYLVLFSVSLDLFLWLGPRIRVNNLVQSFIQQMLTIPELQTPDMAETLKLSSEFWKIFFREFNLLSMLRTFPIGIPSLIVSQSSTKGSPLGLPVFYEIESFGTVIVVSIGLLFLGISLGAFYFLMIGQASVAGKVNWVKLLHELPWAIIQTFFLTMATLFLFVAFLIPLSCVLTTFYLFGFAVEQIGVIVVMIFGLLLIWWLLPLVFTPFSVYLYHQTLWVSLRKSIQVARMTLPRTSLFFLAVVVLSVGMDYLWTIPPVNSWWMLVGIVGHAFVAASLVAATFIYFDNANKWSAYMLEQAKLLA